MDSKDFTKMTKAQLNKTIAYINDRAPGMVAAKTLRFIDGNFRAGGWQGRSFVKWKANKKKTTTLIKTGALRRSINYKSVAPGQIMFYTNVPYAAMHNRGGKISKTISVKAHSRDINQKDEVSAPGARKEKWIKKKTGTAQVKAHSRNLNLDIEQRQFAPYQGSESPVLAQSISRELEKEFIKILKS